MSIELNRFLGLDPHAGKPDRDWYRRWVGINSESLKIYREKAKQFKIVGEDKPQYRPGYKGSHTEFSFQTMSEGQFTLNLQSDFWREIDVEKTTSVDCGEESLLFLMLRQNFRQLLAESQEDSFHTKAIYFFASNWDRLSRVLDQSYVVNGKLPRLIETALSESGQADFIGLSGKGRVFILEFGKNGKEAQVNGYAEQLKSMFPDIADQIQPLVVRYSGRDLQVKIPRISTSGVSQASEGLSQP